MADAPPDDTKIPAVPSTPAPGEGGHVGSPAKAAADKQQSGVPGEPLKGEVSRTDAAAAKAAAPARPAAAAAKPAGAAAAAEHPPRVAAPTGPPDPPPSPTATPPAFVAGLQAILPEGALRLSFWVGDWTIIIPAAHILDVARYLRDARDASF